MLFCRPRAKTRSKSPLHCNLQLQRRTYCTISVRPSDSNCFGHFVNKEDELPSDLTSSDSLTRRPWRRQSFLIPATDNAPKNCRMQNCAHSSPLSFSPSLAHCMSKLCMLANTESQNLKPRSEGVCRDPSPPPPVMSVSPGLCSSLWIGANLRQFCG